LGVSTGEYRQHGGFAEYVAVPARILYALPEGVSFIQGTMVEPLSVALHSVNITPRRVDDSVVVVGAGMVGLLVIQCLRAAGYGQIIAVDIDEGRLELALKLGADVGLNSSDKDLSRKLLQLTDGRGANRAFEVVGIPATFQLAVHSVRKGGAVTLVGNVSPTVELPLQAVVTREITLYGSCSSQGEYPAALDLLHRGLVNVNPLISEVAPLSDGAAWFERLYNREAGMMKIVLEP
jgi:threonine dehydrogenase-like Zn-dependent dehydrogenase